MYNKETDMIYLAGINKEYPASSGQKGVTQIALSNVSLRIKKGEFVFLTGPSGAGKTTLLKIILGIMPPDKGEVIVMGEALHTARESKINEIRRNIGVVFQDNRLLKNLNAAENVELPLHFIKMSKKLRQSRVKEILEILELSHHAEANIATLSAGEKQRLSLARALVTSPNLIVADEPTGNLDPKSARSLIQLLKRLRGSGTTVLVATHDMSLVKEFGSRVLELVSGNVKKDDSDSSYKVPSFWRGDIML